MICAMTRSVHTRFHVNSCCLVPAIDIHFPLGPPGILFDLLRASEALFRKVPMVLLRNHDHDEITAAYSESAMQDTLKDISTMIEDVERLFQRVASEGGQCAGESVDHLRESLGSIRERFTKLEHRVQHQVRRRMRETNRYVHENPWQTIGVAAAVAYVLGALTARRRGH
jgi:ElaB/YqjD/DUF883 family membrane-anchored ribosome-binding protein